MSAEPIDIEQARRQKVQQYNQRLKKEKERQERAEEKAEQARKKAENDRSWSVFNTECRHFRRGIDRLCTDEGWKPTERDLLKAIVERSTPEWPFSFEAQHGVKEMARFLGLSSFRATENAIARLKRRRILIVSHTDPEHPEFTRYTIHDKVIRTAKHLGIDSNWSSWSSPTSTACRSQSYT